MFQTAAPFRSVLERPSTSAAAAPAQDDVGRLAAANRRVAFASHRRAEESTRGDKVLRTRA